MPDMNFGNPVFAVAKLSHEGFTLLGTCFAIGGSRFVTAAHVTGASSAGLQIVFPRVADINEYQDCTTYAVNHISAEIEAYDPIHDIVIIKSDAIKYSSVLSLSSSDECGVGATVRTYGFPHADSGGRLVLTEQESRVGARVLLGTNEIKIKHLILNIQTRPGQSGSPVMTPSGNVAAMVTGGYKPPSQGTATFMGVDPSTLHQTTHAVSAEYILDMIQ